MLDLGLAQQVCWGLSFALRLLMLCLLFFRNGARTLPYFSFYLLANVIQTVLLNLTYKTWGEWSPQAYKIAWGSEALVICTRALAIAELCRLLFAGYRGIWSLVSRVLLSCAVLVLAYSALVSQHNWNMAVLGANRALELGITAVVVTLFVFLRHYGVVAEPTLRDLALGFCIYSSVAVVNYTVLEQHLKEYATTWSFLGVVTYLSGLFLWTWALRKSIPQPAADPMLLPSSVYRQLSPEINLRLRLLNERLIQFWNVEAPRP